MLRAFRRHRLQILLILAVFALFAGHAVGAFHLALDGSWQFNWGSLATLFEAERWALPVAAKSPEFLVLLAAGVTLSVLLPLATPIQASLLTFLAAVPIVYLGYVQTGQRPLIPMEYSLLTVLVLFVVNVLVAYYSEVHRKQELISAFGQYLPPHLVHVISREPERFSLEGESRELSVMFCDVHNFTAIAEALGPRQLVRLLNALFTPVTKDIYDHRGTIDKYMGDAVMAFWGAPMDDPEHARHALAAAFEIQRTLAELQPAFRARGWPEITMGVGVNSGVANVGNMGSEYRIAYTAVGDTVNLAARLEELTRIYGVRIIAGEATRAAVPEMLWRELDLVQVKGRQGPIRIYEPLGWRAELGEAAAERAERHDQALRLYHGRDWEGAAAAFEALHRDAPGDPVCALYLERLRALRAEPPPANWHGVARYTAKV